MPGVPALSKPPLSDGATQRERVSSSRHAAARGDSGEASFNLGRYAIVSRIASGGMATVYRARLENEGGFARAFAIKVIHPHLAEAEGFKERFLDEARVASRVQHPNVVSTIDSAQSQGYHYLVLGLIDGVTLRQLQLALGPKLSAREAALIVCDAARGLHAVHSVVDDAGEALDVVHRDLSPHNLMLDATGRAILIDLGLAKARGQLGHTQTGVLCGKLPYMSPEQSLLAPLDARSDVFSLGSVLFELAVGQPPFGDDHTPGTLQALRECDPERLASTMTEADVPDWLRQILLRCLRAEPEDRYPTADALAEALDDGLRRAGHGQSAIRVSLGEKLHAARAEIGPDLPAEPLPQLIHAETSGVRTGPVPAVPRVPAWLRGIGMAATGALVVLLVLLLGDRLMGGQTEAQDVEGEWLRGLSPYAAPEDEGDTQTVPAAELEPEPAPAPAPVPARVEPDPEPINDGAAAKKPRKPRPVEKPQDEAPSGFKTNPYD